MATIPRMGMIQMVPPVGEAESPVMCSLGRSLALVHATAYFLESMQPALKLPERERERFVQHCIAGFAMNVHTITGADAKQARADVQQLAATLGIELLNLPMANTEGQAN